MTGSSAGFGRRFAALLYDALLLAAILLLFTGLLMIGTRRAITTENVGAWAYAYRLSMLAILAGYYVLHWTRSGQTLGMRAWRLRAVTDAGRPIRWRTAALRWVCGILAWAPAGLGVLWLYVDPERAALQDRLSKTRVVHLTGA